MHKIDGAQVAGDGYQCEALRRFSQDDSATNVGAIEDQPDVSGAILQRALVGGVGGDQVFPAAQVICLANGIHGRLIGNPSGSES